MNYNKPSAADKIVSALSYLSFGFIGFIWLVAGLLMKRVIRPFLIYHIYQSIFLSILLYVLGLLINIMVSFLKLIPFLGKIIFTLFLYLNTPMYWNYTITQVCMLMIIGYLTLGALLGQYSYLPWISSIIKGNIRR